MLSDIYALFRLEGSWTEFSWSTAQSIGCYLLLPHSTAEQNTADSSQMAETTKMLCTLALHRKYQPW